MLRLVMHSRTSEPVHVDQPKIFLQHYDQGRCGTSSGGVGGFDIVETGFDPRKKARCPKELRSSPDNTRPRSLFNFLDIDCLAGMLGCLDRDGGFDSS
jgi:hypothetical protein